MTDLTDIQFIDIDDEDETSDEYLGLSVGIDPAAQMIILTQDNPMEEDGYDMVVLSITEFKRFLQIVNHSVSDKGELKNISFEVHRVQ